MSGLFVFWSISGPVATSQSRYPKVIYLADWHAESMPGLCPLPSCTVAIAQEQLSELSSRTAWPVTHT